MILRQQEDGSDDVFVSTYFFVCSCSTSHRMVMVTFVTFHHVFDVNLSLHHTMSTPFSQTSYRRLIRYMCVVQRMYFFSRIISLHCDRYLANEQTGGFYRGLATKL